MKILVFIMAFAVLACSVIPCRELAFAGNNHSQSVLVKASDQQEHSDSDNCSPFCSCNCCCSITCLFATYQPIKPIEIALKKGVFHLPSKISDTALPVWQPPQLV